jgi:aspartate 1-decarboxylase
MYISMLRSKIHHARVTSIDLHYVGSITIDQELLDRAGIYVYEKVLVADVENGARFETYVLPGELGSKTIQLNGPTGRLASIGDRLVIMAFAFTEAPPPGDWKPQIIALNEHNQII